MSAFTFGMVSVIIYFYWNENLKLSKEKLDENIR